MLTAVLKMYFIGTALSVLAVIYGIVDSFGGLMYTQDHHYTLDLDQQAQSPVQRQSPLTKNID